MKLKLKRSASKGRRQSPMCSRWATLLQLSSTRAPLASHTASVCRKRRGRQMGRGGLMDSFGRARPRERERERDCVRESVCAGNKVASCWRKLSQKAHCSAGHCSIHQKSTPCRPAGQRGSSVLCARGRPKHGAELGPEWLESGAEPKWRPLWASWRRAGGRPSAPSSAISAAAPLPVLRAAFSPLALSGDCLAGTGSSETGSLETD